MTPEEVIHILLSIKTESIYEDEAIRIAVESLKKNESSNLKNTK